MQLPEPHHLWWEASGRASWGLVITRTTQSRRPAHQRTGRTSLCSGGSVCASLPHLILTRGQQHGIIIHECKSSQGWDQNCSRRYILWWRRVTLEMPPFTSSRKREPYNFSEKKSGQISNLRRGHFWSLHTHNSPTLSDRAALAAQTVKNLPAMQETRVWSLARKIPWRRERQPTPILLPGKFYGQRSLAGCSPWRKGFRQCLWVGTGVSRVLTDSWGSPLKPGSSLERQTFLH